MSGRSVASSMPRCSPAGRHDVWGERRQTDSCCAPLVDLLYEHTDVGYYYVVD